MEAGADRKVGPNPAWPVPAAPGGRAGPVLPRAGLTSPAVSPQRQREEAAETSDLSGEEDDDYVPYVPVKQRKQQMVMGPGAAGGGLRVSLPTRGLSIHLHPLPSSCRNCCRCGGRWCRRMSSGTAGASSEVMRMTSPWGPSPTSASWTSTSTSKRRQKVGEWLVVGPGSFREGLKPPHSFPDSPPQLGRSRPRRNS